VIKDQENSRTFRANNSPGLENKSKQKKRKEKREKRSDWQSDRDAQI
jgi:hypothetical protein